MAAQPSGHAGPPPEAPSTPPLAQGRSPGREWVRNCSGDAIRSPAARQLQLERVRDRFNAACLCQAGYRAYRVRRRWLEGEAPGGGRRRALLGGGLVGCLQPHQLAGVRWLFRAVVRGGGVLADDQGLGKTQHVAPRLGPAGRPPSPHALPGATEARSHSRVIALIDALMRARTRARCCVR